MRSGKLFWAKTLLASEVINLQAIFDDYWSSSKHEFTIQSQSFHQLSASIVSDGEPQRTLLSMENTISMFGL
jgi:hypothetical protein